MSLISELKNETVWLAQVLLETDWHFTGDLALDKPQESQRISSCPHWMDPVGARM
jgi:hypothetical protein